MTNNRFILKVNCKDERGIVARITTPLYQWGCTLITLDQFTDLETERFFMRLTLEGEIDYDSLNQRLKPIFDQFEGDCSLIRYEQKMRLLILCSKPDHCLVDLLAKTKRDSLPVEITGVISNHDHLRQLVEWYGYPYHYLPVTEESKDSQEKQIAELFHSYKAHIIILARYMQILSNKFCKQFEGKAINIHHSFLPSFKGAQPYKQAYNRGVKIIGATAHFVTGDLDEGPIIQQEIIRVNHTHSPKDLAHYGADVEAIALSKAVKYTAEHRVFINDNKTVVLK